MVCKLVRINLKPLSANNAFRGRRYKTPEYKAYEKAMLLVLPKLTIPEGPLKITFIFGLSSRNADGDNCIKQAQDIIAKKYGFNDSRIDHWIVHKVYTGKGREYLSFEIEASDIFLTIHKPEAA